MSDDDVARYRAMVEFLSTFPTLSGAPPTDLSDLSDGVALFEVLSEIAPDYFDPTTIARHLGDNWALKSSNLRKLIRNLEHYFQDELNKDAPDSFSNMNLSAIARQGEPEAISELVELVAAAAVSCPEKGEYIGRIMTMSQESQIQMKFIIERSLARLEDYEHDDDDDDDHEEGADNNENELVFNNDGDEAEAENADDDKLFAADHLKKSTGGYDEEKEQLEKALVDVRRELAAHKSQASLLEEDHEKAQAKLRALVEDLQDRLVKRQDDLIAAEEELRAKTTELDETKNKLAELEETKAQLADELDVANARAEQLRKAEATVVAYRKKLEGVGVMNQQMTDLEDQAANYLRQIMDLEAEVKKSASLQKKIEDLERNVESLEKEKNDATDSLKSTAAEVADLKSRLNAADSAKKMYEEELQVLREVQQNGDALDALDDERLSSNVEGLSLTSAQSIKEKSMRLELENKKLREELENLKSASATSTATAKSSGNNNAIPANAQREIQRLKDELAKKEKENTKVKSDKEKLETYTKKTLAKFQDKYLVALQECKAKLKEKQDKIEALESRSASEKTSQKREERLLSSTIYELGLAIMQNRLKER